MTEVAAPVAVPGEFTGGWLRRSIALDGGAPVERSVVWWLQAPSRFADLRVPLADGVPPQSFAGATTWEAPALTWQHELDLESTADSDTGRVHWEGDLLIEEGEGFGGRYVEVWQRLPGTDGASCSLRRDGARLVRTGSHALTLVDARAQGGAYEGVGWRLEADGWVEALRWPAGSSTPLASPPDPAALTPGTSVVLSDGATWLVEESAP